MNVGDNNMMTKKTKIAIFIIIILIIIIGSVFVITNRQNNNQPNGNNNFEELNLDNLELSNDQLNLYKEIVQASQASKTSKTKEEICLERDDKLDCISLLAYVKKDPTVCFDLHNHQEHDDNDNHDHENCSFLQDKCTKNFLKKEAKSEIDKCVDIEGDEYFNCVNGIFTLYEKKEDCEDLSNNDARSVCEEIFDYKEMYLIYDRALCKNLKNEKLNKYCLKNIKDKLQDTDGDGLTDLDEANIYKTNPHIFDTDNDGYSDGEEVEKGYNPRGEGKLE